MAEEIGAGAIAIRNVQDDAQLDAVVIDIIHIGGALDILLYSIVFAPKDDLYDRVVDCPSAGVGKAMDVSAHSFLRMIHRVKALILHGGTCMMVPFLGVARVIGQHNIMGPVKAAFEAEIRYPAVELGRQDIPVHALSPGPFKICAASGLVSFDTLPAYAANRAPTRCDD